MDDSINDFAMKKVQELLNSLSREVPEILIKLFEIDKKKELEKYCKDLVISSDNFWSLINNSIKINYYYFRKFRDFVPEKLQIKHEDFDALSDLKLGEKIDGQAKIFFNKIDQMSIQRRFLIAHLFIKIDNKEKWHLFYFDQKDLNDNHWRGGSHLHFVNYLWPNYNPNDIWDTFNKSNASIGGKLHIKFSLE